MFCFQSVLRDASIREALRRRHVAAVGDRAGGGGTAGSMAGGTMEGLFMARDGRIAHFSSYDRTGGNDDFVELAPDETHTLVDHSGEAGIIRRWWVTIAPRDNRKI